MSDVVFVEYYTQYFTLILLSIVNNIKTIINTKNYNNIKIYPNPNDGVMNVEIPMEYSDVGNTKISIYSLNGKMVKEIMQKNVTKISVDIKSCIRGTYIITIENKKIRTFSKKLFIN